jgi:LysR family transcriptional regulator, hca operon transcriptional activator
MELRHLHFFVAVAETGSLTVAAEKRLNTAQPSLSRQMRDLEAELGCELMIRGARGIELTGAGRVLLDHARAVLLQVEAAKEATRRVAKASFVIGFLTGYEIEWLSAVMAIMRDQLPNTEVVILSLSSPDLADGLARGKIDLAFLRRERNAPGVTFTLLRDEPLMVLMPAHSDLAKGQF